MLSPLGIPRGLVHSNPENTMSHRAAIALAASSSREAYERWLEAAEALPEETLVPVRADVHVATLNLQVGLEAVLGEAESLAQLPEGTVDNIVALGSLGSAALYAQIQLARTVAKPSTVRAMIREGHRFRALALVSAEALATAGVFDANRVKAIRSGRGAIDMAGDCVALAELYRERPAAWAGKVPIGATEIEEMGRLGNDLLRVLRPATAPKKVTTNEVTAATRIRNQLWTLLVRAWERDLWRAGAWVFGKEVDTKVPSLTARTRVDKKKDEETGALPGAST